MNTQKALSEFKKYQAFVKKECDEGRCTKGEAVSAILGYVQEMLLSLKVELPEEPEQENMYQARVNN